jgi:hypothetical protein
MKIHPIDRERRERAETRRLLNDLWKNVALLFLWDGRDWRKAVHQRAQQIMASWSIEQWLDFCFTRGTANTAEPLKKRRNQQ